MNSYQKPVEAVIGLQVEHIDGAKGEVVSIEDDGFLKVRFNKSIVTRQPPRVLLVHGEAFFLYVDREAIKISPGLANQRSQWFREEERILEERREEKEKIERRRRAEENEKIRLEEEKRTAERLDKIAEWQAKRERKRIEKRNALRKKIFDILDLNFLLPDKIIIEKLSGEITEKEIQQDRGKFVQAWFSRRKINGYNDYEVPDDDQAAAIAATHGDVQVVARAGSGKTATLVNRAIFFVQHCRIPPSEILILAFNRKAALEVKKRFLLSSLKIPEKSWREEVKRIKSERSVKLKRDLKDVDASAIEALVERSGVALPHVMTFHSLAYALVHPEEDLLYDDADSSDSKALSIKVQRILDDLLDRKETYGVVRKVMMAHFKTDWEAIVEGGYLKSKEGMLEYRRSLPRMALSGVPVKSYGEKIIADFLFENDIAFQYERNHRWDGRNYKPDFTIKKSNESGVVIEYFGLVGDPDYDLMSSEKREYWGKKEGWELLELTPDDISPNPRVAEKKISRYLTDKDIPFRRLTDDEIWLRIKDRAVDRFTGAVKGFVGRCRKKAFTVEHLSNLVSLWGVEKGNDEHDFLNIAVEVYRAYLESLHIAGEDDFDGLLQRAAEKVRREGGMFSQKSGQGDLRRIKYLFIDEFQDFSFLFFDLIAAVREKNDKVEIFCVGDDWQSINGFAGAELSYFERFSSWSEGSKKLYLSKNYRSVRKVVEVGNSLMKGLGKPAVAHKGHAGDVLLARLEDFTPSSLEMDRHKGDLITPAVVRIVNGELIEGKNVVLLARKNGLPWYVNYGDSARGGDRLSAFLERVRSFFPKAVRSRITISTVHKYKGLESDVVVLLDVVVRTYPLIHPSWVFFRILGDSVDKIIDEERRLLYVAMTRAGEKLVIMTESKDRSPFISRSVMESTVKNLDFQRLPAPVDHENSCYIVSVSNAFRCSRDKGTYSIREDLKAHGYRWQSQNKSWEKAFLADRFNFNILKKELWFGRANQVEVKITDESESTVKSGEIFDGNFFEHDDI